MSAFVELFPGVDPITIEAEIHEYLEANIEGWERHSGNLDEWIIEVKARLWSQLVEQASTMGAGAFRQFGQKIANVPPILAAPATASSTWTAIDNDGHTIDDGTEVKVPVPGGEPLGFRVVGDVSIAPGSTATKAGEVLLQAIEPGVAANGLSGEATPTSTVVFVDTIMVGESSGGVDEEDEDAYLDRLTEALQLLSLSLVVPRDFEVDARGDPDIARALCIPGYNAETEEEDVPLAFTVFAATISGGTLSGPAKSSLQQRQAEKVPSGVLNFVGDPTYTKVDISTKVIVLSGFDPEAVEAAVKARLEEFLASANWDWEIEKVFRNEAISVVDQVSGVSRVDTLELAENGKALATADVALKGLAPLTQPGTLTVTVG